MSEHLHVEPGQWVIAHGYGAMDYEVLRADQVTFEQIRTEIKGRRKAITRRSQVMGVALDEQTARRMVQSLDGCRGEYDRRVRSAREAYDQQVARVLRDAREKGA